MLPSILPLKSCTGLYSFLFSEPFLPPLPFHLFLTITFTLLGLFSLHEIVIIHRFLALMPDDLRLVLFYLPIQSILNALLAKRIPFIVLILPVYRRTVILILIFELDQQILFIIRHHPSKSALIFLEETRQVGRYLTLIAILLRLFTLRLRQQVWKRIDKPFSQVLFVILKPCISGEEAFDPHILYLELEHSAWNTGQVYIKFTLHNNKIIKSEGTTHWILLGPYPMRDYFEY